MHLAKVESLGKIHHLQYFLKPTDNLKLDINNIGKHVQFGVVRLFLLTHCSFLLLQLFYRSLYYF